MSRREPSPCVFRPDHAMKDHKGRYVMCANCGLPQANRRHDPDLIPDAPRDRAGGPT